MGGTLASSGVSSREKLSMSFKANRSQKNREKQKPQEVSGSGPHESDVSEGDRGEAASFAHKRKRRQSIGSRIAEEFGSRRQSIALLREDALNSAFDQEVKISN